MKKETYASGDYIQMTSGYHSGKFGYVIKTDSAGSVALALEDGDIGWHKPDTMKLIHKSKLNDFKPKEGDKVIIAYNKNSYKVGDIVFYKENVGGLSPHRVHREEGNRTRYDWIDVYFVLPLKGTRGSGKVSALSLLGTPQKALR